MTAIFDKQSDPDAQRIIEKYLKQLMAMQDPCDFHVKDARDIKALKMAKTIRKLWEE
jgi:hypothetical protein